jgi:hypothetical protein
MDLAGQAVRAVPERGLVSAAAALLVWVAGWLVERFCRVDRHDDESRVGAHAGPTEPA